MKVAMYYGNADVRIEEAPRPEIKKGELLLKITDSGICGTDIVEWYRKSKIPLVLGHEIVGRIAEIGEGLEGFTIGERVAASHHVPCGECHYCMMDHESACDLLRKTGFYPGGFSEFVRIPSINIEKKGIYKIPAKVTSEEATFIEPLACAIRGQRSSGYKKGQDLLIIGSGISGLLHLKLAKSKNFGKIITTDINRFRLDAAKKYGAGLTIDAEEDVPKKVEEFLGKKADLVILCASAKSAFKQTLQSVDKGGTVLIFASAEEKGKLDLDINKFFWRNEMTITSSYAANPSEHREALRMIEEGAVDVKDMITHTLPLKDIQKGFDLVREAKESIKVIIKPQEE
ncbi:MAG: zinc-dependent dehydrogenase [Candidatus Omnitrophota bacterium]